jgi:cytochrome c peroxidase
VKRAQIFVGMLALAAACAAGGAAGCRDGGKKPAPTAAAPRDAAAAGDAATEKAPTTKVALPAAPPLPPLPRGLPDVPAAPAPITAEIVALGALLFDEPRLAADGTTRCAGCHAPAQGYSGAREPTALGRPNLRRAQPLINAAWQRELGWDGRFASLEEHLAAHLHGQLGADIETALAPLRVDPIVTAHFERSFGRAPGAADAIAALAAFVRTRYAGNSRWDAEEHNPDPGDADARDAHDAQHAQLRAGYQLFVGKAQCAVCHPPPLYTDLAYHRLGLIASPDEGRGTTDASKRGAFKTPTLRDAALRPRFFHDASATSLAGAVAWHLAGGVGQGADRSIVDPALEPIALTAAEQAQLLAFLQALTSRPSDEP